MTKTVGGILGTLIALLVASLILVTSQGEACSNDWWSCAPGSSPALTAQFVGIVALLIGPFVGFRVGAWLGPRLDRRTGAAIVGGTLPGWITLALGWWFPYSAVVMLVGAAIAGMVAHRTRSNA